MRALDTNVLVRALVQDDPAQAKLAADLIGAGVVYIPVTVILELEWILRSRYGYPRGTIADAIEKLARLENAVVADAEAVISAAQKLRWGWDFADGLHHALSAGCEDFLTFDRQLGRRASRVAGVEPRVTTVRRVRR